MKQYKVYQAIKEFAPETMISCEQIAQKTGLTFYGCEAIMRALAKEKIISLAAICETGSQPCLGVFDGTAKEKEYYFMLSHPHLGFEKEMKKALAE